MTTRPSLNGAQVRAALIASGVLHEIPPEGWAPRRMPLGPVLRLDDRGRAAASQQLEQRDAPTAPERPAQPRRFDRALSPKEISALLYE